MRKAIAGLAVLAVFGAAPLAAQDSNMSFFVVSAGPGDGANLGGLEGADQHCQALASGAGLENLTWRAYLSAISMGGQAAVNARDRIGEGPWHNYAGDLIAGSVEELHSADVNLNKQSILSEQGQMANGRGDDPNMHDFLTGSNADGTVYVGEGNDACDNWRSNDEGSARVGHHDRQGGGDDGTSWNSAHGSRGCSQENLQATGGNGFFYCFAIDGNSDQQPIREW